MRLPRPSLGRFQRGAPAIAGVLLERIPVAFYDDGCSRSPDALLGFNFRWACRIHDWYWCSRSWPRGSMTAGHKITGDLWLERLIRASLPFWLRATGVSLLYQVVVKGVGRSYDTCRLEPKHASAAQLEAGLCRHSMPLPAWMEGEAGAFPGS